MSSERMIYISGQMTGRPDEARPEFAAAAERLKAAGYAVRNPHDHPVRSTWCEYMRHDLEFIASPACGGIALLPTAGNSVGAMVEIVAGLACGLVVRSLDGWINSSPVERDARSMLKMAFSEGVPNLANRLARPVAPHAAGRANPSDDPVIATDPLGCFRVVRRPTVFADHQPRYGVEVFSGNGWEPAEPWSRVDGSAVQLLAAEVDRLRKGGAQ